MLRGELGKKRNTGGENELGGVRRDGDRKSERWMEIQGHQNSEVERE